MEPRRLFAVNAEKFQATPAAKPNPNVILHITLHLFATADKNKIVSFIIACSLGKKLSIIYHNQCLRH